jgi:hypothetical protein
MLLFWGLVDISVLQDQWGGTPVQAWMTPDALSVCNRNVTVAAPPSPPMPSQRTSPNQPTNEPTNERTN